MVSQGSQLGGGVFLIWRPQLPLSVRRSMEMEGSMEPVRPDKPQATGAGMW